MAETTHAGRFITLEGGEGAGKSTQVAALAKRLRQAGRDVVTTREPGGAPGAETIRTLLVSGTTDRWDPLSEALLLFAARRENLVHTIWPALQRGCWVVCDRFADSTLAYQGYGHGVDIALIEALYGAAVGTFRPDLTLILDLPVEEGLRRAGRRDTAAAAAHDRYERMDRAFHERLRAGFLAIAAAAPERCTVIDASGAADAVAGDIWRAVAGKFASELADQPAAGATP